MPAGEKFSAALLAASALWLGGCAVAQTEPPAQRPFGEVERFERGVVAAVHDTMIDLRTGQSRAIATRTPTIPVAGVVGVALPVTLGGEKRRDVPGEEITVRLVDGKLVLIVQELSHPAFATGERVRVLHERPNHITGESRTRIAREE